MNCVNCSIELAENSRFCSVCGVDQESPDSSPRTSGSATSLMARLAEVLQGRYRITKMAGRGGMAAVFLAEDLTLERPVAIKVLPPEVAHDERLVGRFEREARTAAKLDHPNIIPIYAVEHSTDLYYFVMKYVAGDSLDQVLKRGQLPIERAQDLLWESARALGHAHHRGVIHRDVKPANIMIDHDGRVILTDFGISKAVQAATQFTGTGQVIGTPHYMSPEQAKGGEVDGRSDQYSLGIVGYQMVTGRLPFGDDSIHAVIYKHVSEAPPLIRDLNPDCPPFIATAIHRALQKKPADRFQTMEAFAQALCPDRRLSVPTTSSPSRIASSASASSAPTEISQTTVSARTAGRGRMAKMAAALVVLTAAGVGGYWSWDTGLLAGMGLPGPQPAVEPNVEETLASGSVLDSSGLRSPSDTMGQLLTSVVDDSADLGSQPEIPNQEPEPRVSNDPPPTRARGADEVLTPAAPLMGSLSVNTSPYGRLFIDGVFEDDTPQFELEIAVGRHIIRVENDSCRPLVDTVTVRAGRVTSINKPLICS